MTHKSFKFKEHNAYVTEQVERHYKTQDRTRGRPHEIYVNKLKESFPEAKKVLCVGARDASEVQAFIDAGFESIGIDLWSTDEDLVKLVDMHTLPDNFAEDEFDVIFSCHSLEHSRFPDVVFQGFRKCTRLGAFIVLPFQLAPNSKDPTVFSFMEAGGCKFKIDNPGEGVTKEMVQVDFNDLLEDSFTCEVTDLVVCPLKPSQDDGYWISVKWNK